MVTRGIRVTASPIHMPEHAQVRPRARLDRNEAAPEAVCQPGSPRPSLLGPSRLQAGAKALSCLSKVTALVRALLVDAGLDVLDPHPAAHPGRGRLHDGRGARLHHRSDNSPPAAGMFKC